MNWISWTEPEYNGEYPLWARAIGWMIMISTLLGIPAHAIFEFIRNKGNFMEVSGKNLTRVGIELA